MNFSKPIPEVEGELAREVRRILKKADRPEQCARWFTNLDRIHPDIHELIERIQRATGNDCYFCMFAGLSLRQAFLPNCIEDISRVIAPYIASMFENWSRKGNRTIEGYMLDSVI